MPGATKPAHGHLAVTRAGLGAAGLHDADEARPHRAVRPLFLRTSVTSEVRTSVTSEPAEVRRNLCRFDRASMQVYRQRPFNTIPVRVATRALPQ